MTRNWWDDVRTSGLTGDAVTDELAKEGARRKVHRQCSIGWHDECSDTWGDCECPCHELMDEALESWRLNGLIP